MKWTDGVVETEEGHHLFLARLRWFLIDMPARDEWGNSADGRAAAWTYGFACGLYFRDAELHREEIEKLVAEGREKYPGLIEAFSDFMNQPSMISQICPPSPPIVGVGPGPKKVRPV